MTARDMSAIRLAHLIDQAETAAWEAEQEGDGIDALGLVVVTPELGSGDRLTARVTGTGTKAASITRHPSGRAT